MKAVYPGSFDPFTNGHFDILSRGLEIFESVIVGVANNSAKKHMFELNERIQLINETIKEEWVGLKKRVQVHALAGLTVDFCKQRDHNIILRGIRAVTDYEYEQAIGQINSELEPGIETVCLFASRDHAFISSSMIREIAAHGRDISKYVSEPVAKAIKEKFAG